MNCAKFKICAVVDVLPLVHIVSVCGNFTLYRCEIWLKIYIKEKQPDQKRKEKKNHAERVQSLKW